MVPSFWCLIIATATTTTSQTSKRSLGMVHVGHKQGGAFNELGPRNRISFTCFYSFYQPKMLIDLGTFTIIS